jgi:hypothetical protein
MDDPRFRRQQPRGSAANNLLWIKNDAPRKMLMTGESVYRIFALGFEFSFA